MKRTMIRRVSVAAVAVVVALGMAACGDDDADKAPSTSTESAATASASDAAEQGALVLKDGYVGAKDASKAMTAVFGDLQNTTDKDIHLTSVKGTFAGIYQIHEVVDGVMRETDDGIVIPANGSVHMAPGGHHIMIMENNDVIAAGDELTLTLTDADGKSYEVSGIPVRVQQSGHEDYAGDTAPTTSGAASAMDDMAGMTGMNHSN